MAEFLENVFKLRENKSSIRVEVTAGVTTFMTMAYILAVNPDILGATGMDKGAVFVATALGAALGTIIMAFGANYPFALAPGMGLNAFFAYTVVGQLGCSWQTALAAVFIEGIIFILLSLTPVREKIFNCIPHALKIGISGGIGLFIAFIGLQNAKIIVAGPCLVGLYPLKEAVASGAFHSTGVGVLLALVGIIVTALFMHKKVPGDILLGILVTWGLGIVCELTGIYVPDPKAGMFSVLPNFSNGFSIPSLAPTFMQMDFSGLLTFNFVTIMLTFMFVDLFDTLGTLIGVTSRADMLDEKGQLPRIKGALLADSMATVAGAVLGTSTVSTFVESSAGVSVGGRTGLTSVVTAGLFLVSLLLAPLFLAIPGFATAPALVMVGYLMLSNVARIDFDDLTEAIPAYGAIIATPFAYSISEGIAFGVMSYAVLNLLTAERRKKVSPLLMGLAGLFALKYFFI